MIELQRHIRRQNHIETLKECEKFVEQFYDNFNEKKQEIKEQITLFMSASDQEIDTIMGTLTDENLLANDITFVNAAWEKITVHRNSRR